MIPERKSCTEQVLALATELYISLVLSMHLSSDDAETVVRVLTHLVTISFSLLEAWPPLQMGWTDVDKKYSLWFLKYWSTNAKTT